VADRLSPSSRGALAATGTVAVVTALWWGFALWPLPDIAPPWIERARAVCFGSTPGGLPDASGWIALILQPLTMALVAVSIWGRELHAAARTATGRGVAALCVVAMAIAGAGVAWRVVDASTRADILREPPPGRAVRLDRPVPPLRLTDQRGAAFDLERLRGRPVLVTFAFAHCQTVCPVLVREAIAAQRATPDVEAAVVVVTLDPWRDTPSRLPHLARDWGLGSRGWALSGPVAEVESVLDAWGIQRSRDARDGDVVHAPRVFVVDRRGRIAYTATGSAGTLIRLLRAI
jgi:protein SCO1/2